MKDWTIRCWYSCCYHLWYATWDCWSASAFDADVVVVAAAVDDGNVVVVVVVAAAAVGLVQS